MTPAHPGQAHVWQLVVVSGLRAFPLVHGPLSETVWKAPGTAFGAKSTYLAVQGLVSWTKIPLTYSRGSLQLAQSNSSAWSCI